MGLPTIQQLTAKGKAYLDNTVAEWGLFALITLSVVSAFSLGRLSALVDSRPLIELQAATAAVGQGMPLGGHYVASRTGSVYYFPWCAGAAQIAPQNERWFKNEAEAKKAGYRPAKNCKGLVGE